MFQKQETSQRSIGEGTLSLNIQRCVKQPVYRPQLHHCQSCPVQSAQRKRVPCTFTVLSQCCCTLYTTLMQQSWVTRITSDWEPHPLPCLHLWQFPNLILSDWWGPACVGSHKGLSESWSLSQTSLREWWPRWLCRQIQVKGGNNTDLEPVLFQASSGTAKTFHLTATTTMWHCLLWPWQCNQHVLCFSPF